MLDVAPRGGKVAGRGDLERALIRERKDALYHALSERAGADQGREVVVLQRARRDLRGAGGVFVHQYDQRMQPVDGVTQRRFARDLTVAANRRDDRPLRDEQARDLDGGVQQASAVVAQIEDVGARAGGARGEQRLEHLVARRRSEVREAYVIDIPLHLRAYGRNVNDLAHDVVRAFHRRLIVRVGAQADRRSGLAANHRFDAIDRQVAHRFTVDGVHDLAGLHS